ncbi:imidazole glycerol phosphate synthase subunit HisH [Flaviflexus massiliensis]|uniref:imidazole glycerol phosphate synthase subunit HisH n=1 Tax=Flaviflexus massiliensis TaxID=1522309 RepID=UPI0006D542B2|nr:imidazole glycerol phosphate synthase subunit HisH [Flaviflexus massiliensis]
MNVVVFDYGSGNVHSVARALGAAGADVELTSDPAKAMAADGLVVPGVGAFDTVVSRLRALRGERFIERRLAGGMPVLGICVGLQILFEGSDEHDSTKPGLEQFPGRVTRIQSDIVPHTGWSTVEAAPGSKLFQGIENERFYFVHSYGVHTDPAAKADERFEEMAVTWAEHGSRFIAAIEQGPLSAVQFHPEKSGEAGLQLLRNWLSTLKDRS